MTAPWGAMTAAEALDMAQRLAEATANLDAYIEARAGERAEVLAEPIRVQLAEAGQSTAMEIQRREDLSAEFRRQLAVLEKRANSLTELVFELTDLNPCVHDAHGYCTAHDWRHDDKACPHARAKVLRPRRVRPAADA